MRSARKETEAFVPLGFSPGEAVQIDWGEAMAELCAIDKSGISRHLKCIFESGELEEQVAVAKMQYPQSTAQFQKKSRFLKQIIITWMQLFLLVIARTPFVQPISAHGHSRFEGIQGQRI